MGLQGWHNEGGYGKSCGVWACGSGDRADEDVVNGRESVNAKVMNALHNGTKNLR